MNQSLKLKYQSHKLQVKIWEDEFMRNNGRIPSKEDIKQACSSVRHAYKSYYALKRELLRPSCVDSDKAATNDRNPPPICEPPVNSAEASSAVTVLEGSVPSNVPEHGTATVPGDLVLADVNSSLEVLFSDKIITQVAKPKKDIIPVFNNGGNLKELTTKLSALKNQIIPPTIDNTEDPFSSAEAFSSKLEPAAVIEGMPKNIEGAWGNHLNKACEKSKGIKKLRDRTSSFHFTEKLFVSSKFKNKRNPLKPHVPLRRTMSECFSVLSGTDTSCDSAAPSDQTPPEDAVTLGEVQLFSKCKVTVKDSSQQSSFQSASKSLTEAARTLDAGWLSRCTQSFENSITDFVAKQDKIQIDKLKQESENAKQIQSDGLKRDSKPEICQNVDSNNLPQETCVKTDALPEVSCRRVPSSDDDNEVVSDSDTEPPPSILLPPKRKASEALSPPPSAKRVPGAKKSRQEVLEKKMSDGRGSENFVKINIKKKVFVRGRKNTSYSKYKKMMYKKKQVGSGSSYVGGGKGKCFTCGEAGHWANNCPQKGGLMPVEEADQIDDSPYLTLEEAGALADQDKPASRFAPMPQPDSITGEDKCPVEDNVIPPRNFIPPLYPWPEDGQPPKAPKEVLAALKKFGHKSFRPGQQEAVMRVLSGMSSLVMLSTGAGKSLCYQLPAYLYAQHNEKCLTLVVSPLVSLMEDQVNNLPGPLVGACLHTNQTPKQREEVKTQLLQGELHVLLVSPEAVVSCDRQGGLGGLLRDLPPIAFACIDEAHCVSQWSHNFRPSYLMLCKVLRERLKVGTVLGLTATATAPTAASIACHLGVSDGRVISDMPMPENLVLSVSRDSSRDAALVRLLQGARFSACESIIIYCIRREECERVAGLLRTCLQDSSKKQSTKQRALSWNAEAYHAGLTAHRRKQVQQSFMNGKLRIVVATVAFGMGINKNNLRAVVHYNMPASFERFVQEVGRAGRDGLPAHCHLFLDSRSQDLNELRRHIYSDSIDRHVIRKLLLRVFKPCKCLSAVEQLESWDPTESQSQTEATPEEGNTQEGLNLAKSSSESPVKSPPAVRCPGHEVAFLTEETVQALDLPEENILTLLCYLELNPRHWVEVLPSAYVLCKVTSYAGPAALKAAAKKCPPLAMAVALDSKAGVSHDRSSSIEFRVVDVAAAIGWDSGQAKHQLKELEWRKVGTKWQRSALKVQLSGPGLRVRAKGCLPPEELDEALDWLTRRVETQERSKLLQLEALFSALTSVSYATCDECLEEVDDKRCADLKASVKKYFGAEENADEQPKLLPGVSNEEQVCSDVCAMVGTFSDTSFTGRAVARIFHGISSPCYPAHVWGRTKFWRLHLNDNFPALCRIATSEILRLRS